MERNQYSRALRLVELHKQRIDKLAELYDKQDKILSMCFTNLLKYLKMMYIQIGLHQFLMLINFI